MVVHKVPSLMGQSKVQNITHNISNIMIDYFKTIISVLYNCKHLILYTEIHFRHKYSVKVYYILC